MDASSLIAPILLTVACVAFIFWPQRRLFAAPEKTRLDYLRERRDVVYDNLRDLNFEHRAGKYPEEDFQSQRSALEAEAAAVLAEMDALSR